MMGKFANVEEYIDSLPGAVGERLRPIRKIASEAAPGARERISFGMPAVTFDGRDVVFYSGWKRHVALYPLPVGNEELDQDLGPYRAGKGTLQFPHNQPLPEYLVRRVVAAPAGQRSLDAQTAKAPRP